MKTASLFLLLAVLAYVGWELHVTHEQQAQKKSHEMFEGYDRCVAPLDQSLADSESAPDWDRESSEAKGILKAWRDARDGCSDFYFRGKTTPSTTATKEQTMVMYAPDGHLEEVADSRAKFAVEAGFTPVMWFMPPGHESRAYPVPINGTQAEMYKEGWKALDLPLTAAQARAEYWLVRSPRAK